MADSSRIEQLRRRVEADPASIAFAQLAEEYRRLGENREAVRVGRQGLERHPTYASARVTVGRALLALGDLDAAQAEFEQARQTAPDNLAAIRGLADIHQRRGALPEALATYREALDLAPHHPELESNVTELSDVLGVPADLPPPDLALLDLPPLEQAPPDQEPPGSSAKPDPERDRTVTTIEALQRWLDGIVTDRGRRTGGKGG